MRLRLPGHNSKKTGNTAAEYVLSTGILIIVGGIVVFGSNMKDLMRTFFSGSINSNGALGTMQVAKWGSAVAPSAAMNLPPLTAGNEQLCFSRSNACLTVPVISNNNKVDTAGALGGDVVTELAVVLDQLPAILKALKVDQPVIDLVTDVANQGHSIGTDLSAVQTLCPAGQVCQGAPASSAKTKVDVIKTTGSSTLDAKYQTLINYLTNVDPKALDAFPEAKAIIAQKVTQIKSVINGLNAADKIDQVNSTINTAATGASALNDPVYKANAQTLLNELPNINLMSRTGVALVNPNTIRELQIALSSNDTSQATVDRIKALASRVSALNLPTGGGYHGISNQTVSANLPLLQGAASTALTPAQTQVVTSTVNAGTILLGNDTASLVHQDSNTVCNNGGSDCLQKQVGTDWVVIKGNTTTGASTVVGSSNSQITHSANALSANPATPPTP